MGMGVSASAGDLTLDWLNNKISVPAIVHQDPALPRFVGPDTLFVTLSYSGETHETLPAFRPATTRGSNLAAVGTRATLQTLSRDTGAPFPAARPAPAPRAALRQTVVATP